MARQALRRFSQQGSRMTFPWHRNCTRVSRSRFSRQYGLPLGALLVGALMGGLTEHIVVEWRAIATLREFQSTRDAVQRRVR